MSPQVDKLTNKQNTWYFNLFLKKVNEIYIHKKCINIYIYISESATKKLNVAWQYNLSKADLQNI